MALKTKQYLENSWYRGASQDRQTGYAAQFQYAEGVNIRDMKNGVCLAGGNETLFERSKRFIFFPYEGNIYTVDFDGVVRDNESTTLCTLNLGSNPKDIFVEVFGDYIFVASSYKVYQINPSTWTATDRTDANMNTITCCLNYANTYLLYGCMNELWRMDLALGVPTFKKIREFKSGFDIYGLTQDGNYLKIYTSDSIDTKIHYAKGTFDVEDTGLVQTVPIKGMRIGTWCVTSDQNVDYVMFIDGGDIKIEKVQGYNRTLIRKSETRDGVKILNRNIDSSIYACDGIVFVTTDEGIWTFTEYNGWLRGGCVEFPYLGRVYSVNRWQEKLYTCIKVGNSYFGIRYDMSFHPATYQSNGFIISRVFDGGCGSLFKKNIQATVTYNMPTNTSMELSYRYDRSSFGYDKSNFLSIKELTDSNECYDIILPTTPGKTEENYLALQDGDNILLENGDDILLEDRMIYPFNQTRNYLEYRVDFEGDRTHTPILFEHSLLYEDRIRKYR